jgi:tRNA uridine 5-carboxymethylaminomethyl modification enzyme
MKKHYDIIVVGGGHAGIEASLATAQLGCCVMLVTHDRYEIGRMPCNPAIGGLGKGQLVREIDVLGGRMAQAIDDTGIQFRILNRSKGPAVQSPRAQADKQAYQQYMVQAVLQQPNLEVRDGVVVDLLVDSRARGKLNITGVVTADGEEISCARVILATGTFLRGLMHIGPRQRLGGREGAESVENLSGNLARLGFTLRRLKTGTPPRLKRDSIDFAALTPQRGDEEPRPFSFRTDAFQPEQILCHLAHTNERTHAIIRDRLHQSPLYAGIISGRGPRYCPSIEDKVVRFADKGKHLLFLEPEGRDSEEIYVNGLATSLPAEVQLEMVHSIQGLEAAELTRFGYAVEYDSVPSYQVKPTFESKIIDGLYMTGQIIGTSGYEEAAAQGLIAGINSYLSINNQQVFIVDRSEGYIGVLVDDLVTKEISEPYRMFTSRAEHRLMLRCDNAESRLFAHAERISLLPDEVLGKMRAHVEAAKEIGQRLRSILVTPPTGGEALPAAELLRRPGMNLARVSEECPEGQRLVGQVKEILAAAGADRLGPRQKEDILRQVENDIKYEGYIAKHEKLLRKQGFLDHLELPDDLDYEGIQALSFEAREKLARMRPSTLGQASRIDGVRAADLTVLTVVLQKLKG